MFEDVVRAEHRQILLEENLDDIRIFGRELQEGHHEIVLRKYHEYSEFYSLYVGLISFGN